MSHGSSTVPPAVTTFAADAQREWKSLPPAVRAGVVRRIDRALDALASGVCALARPEKPAALQIVPLGFESTNRGDVIRLDENRNASGHQVAVVDLDFRLRLALAAEETVDASWSRQDWLALGLGLSRVSAADVEPWVRLRDIPSDEFETKPVNEVRAQFGEESLDLKVTRLELHPLRDTDLPRYLSLSFARPAWLVDLGLIVPIPLSVEVHRVEVMQATVAPTDDSPLNHKGAEDYRPLAKREHDRKTRRTPGVAPAGTSQWTNKDDKS